MPEFQISFRTPIATGTAKFVYVEEGDFRKPDADAELAAYLVQLMRSVADELEREAHENNPVLLHLERNNANHDEIRRRHQEILGDNHALGVG